MTRVADPLFPSSWPEPLRQAFANLPPIAWTVALSGGLDSVLLLHLALAWRRDSAEQLPLRAIHINHGLQSQANAWAGTCQRLCDQLEVPLEVVAVVVEGDSGRGLEDAARQARYEAFGQRLGKDEALLLGHHADDQAETQLYRMMRGAGLAGFAAMPESRPLGRSRLYRPLLSQTRQSLETRARDAGLSWIEDPSNSSERYDRNYLRNRVMPILRQRWPDVSERMSRNARHGREALMLLDERAADDARRILDRQTGDLYLEPLRQLSAARQRNIIQWWLRSAGLTPLSERQLLHSLPKFLWAKDDGLAEVCWDGYVLRRYNDSVRVLRQSALSQSTVPQVWQPPHALTWGGGELSAARVTGAGLAANGAGFTIQPRRGGERIELASGHHQPLKKWLQGSRIPPWERTALPLVWKDGELVAVGDAWLHPRYSAAAGEPGWVIRWRAPAFRAFTMETFTPPAFELSD